MNSLNADGAGVSRLIHAAGPKLSGYRTSNASTTHGHGLRFRSLAISASRSNHSGAGGLLATRCSTATGKGWARLNYFKLSRYPRRTALKVSHPTCPCRPRDFRTDGATLYALDAWRTDEPNLDDLPEWLSCTHYPQERLEQIAKRGAMKASNPKSDSEDADMGSDA